MSWVGNAEPTVQRQRGRWVVREAATTRVDGPTAGPAARDVLHEEAGGRLPARRAERAGGEAETLDGYLHDVRAARTGLGAPRPRRWSDHGRAATTSGGWCNSWPFEPVCRSSPRRDCCVAS